MVSMEFTSYGLEVHVPGAPTLALFAGFSETLSSGDLMILAGPSGSGKSTLIRRLAALPDPEVKVLGTLEVDPPGARVGLQFQQGALFDDFSVLENVRFGGDHAPQPPDAAEQVRALHWQNANTTLLGRSVLRLSGGQQRLVALERTRRSQPEVLLFDEPTVGLDPRNAQEVARAIREEAVGGRLVVVITHELHYFQPPASPTNHRQRVFLLSGQAITPLNPDPTVAIPEAIARLQAGAAGAVSAPARGSRWGALTVRVWNEGWFWPWLPLYRWLLEPLVAGLAQATRGAAGLATTRRWWWQAFYRRVLARSWLSPAAFAYFGLMGILFGFTLGYAGLSYFPEKGYSLPVVFDRLVGVYSMGMYKVIVPLFVSILFAARSGAAVASDLGNRVVARQAEAMQAFRVEPLSYLALPVFLAFLPGLLVLQEFTFLASWLGGALAYLVVEPQPLTIGLREFAFREMGNYLTRWHPWSLTWLKLLITATVMSAYVTSCGLGPKSSGQDVSRSAIQSVLLSTVVTVVITFVFVLWEF